MKKLVFIVISLFIFYSCQSQVNKDEIKKNEPKTNIVVHKEYDEDGNLIRIDSSYSYVYSNIKNDSILEEKLFENLKLSFNNRSKELDSIFTNSFFNDKLFKTNGFYTNDFFERNNTQHEKEIKEILKIFDSIKNKFYSNTFQIENN
ncbi:hypothetical protein [Lutibacter sp.]